MPVLAIGGVFFRANDPNALTAWYERHLGVGAGHNGTGTKTDGDWFWQVEAGPVVFAPFKAATDYWPAEKAFMLNFRVSGLDALLSSLRAAGMACNRGATVCIHARSARLASRRPAVAAAEACSCHVPPINSSAAAAIPPYRTIFCSRGASAR